MKTIKEQVEEVKNKCGNGFELDLNYMVYHNEKSLEKVVNINDKQYIKYHMYFSESYKNFRKDSVIVRLNISKWTKQENGFASSQGIGQTFTLEEGLTRKSFNKLIELSHSIDITQYQINNAKLEDPFLM